MSIYRSAEDQAYIVEVPELPECMAYGSTYAEAVANVEVIIEEWIETAKELGREIPEPRGRLIYASCPGVWRCQKAKGSYTAYQSYA